MQRLYRKSGDCEGEVMPEGARFDSGVKRYITGIATVVVHFPVDWKDNPDISCKQCRFFRTNSRSCALNDEICEFPEKFVGASCPLTRVDEDIDQ